MLSPVGAKSQVIWGVVRRIAVDVVNDFLGRQVSANLLFHYKPMLKDVGNGTVDLGRTRVSVGGNDANVTVSSLSDAAAPLRALLSPLAPHRVCRTDHPLLAPHWVFAAADVAVLRRVGVGEVSVAHRARPRAENPLEDGVLPDQLAAQLARDESSGPLAQAGACARAETRPLTWRCRVGAFAVLTGALHA